MMDYSDRVRIAAMQALMTQGGLSAEDIAVRANTIADEMCKVRNAQPTTKPWEPEDYA